ncbi:hypothetical protein D3C86_782060 [compost metagenome]
MVLQVLPDTGQFVLHRDALGLEFLLRANPREHQQLWAAETTGTEQDFPACFYGLAIALEAQLDTDGFFAFEHNAFGSGRRQHREVLADVSNRFEERGGRAPAPTVADRHIELADAFLVDAIKVGIVAVSGHLPRLDESLRDGMHRVPADIEFALRPVVVACAAVTHFTLAKVRQYIGERPAGIAQRLPIVEVTMVATDVHHAVDRTASAQHLAAWLVAATSVQAGLRYRVKCPVDVSARQDRRDAHRGMDQWRAVFRTGLQQTYRDLGICTQAVGQDTAG